MQQRQQHDQADDGSRDRRADATNHDLAEQLAQQDEANTCYHRLATINVLSLSAIMGIPRTVRGE